MIQQGEKHFTAGALLVTKTSPKKALLIFHKKQQTWFQPGGHIEQYENPIEATIREVKEETGIDISFFQEQIEKSGEDAFFLPRPEYLLEEIIPAHGDEPEHFHLDLLYVISVDEQTVVAPDGESQTFGWFSKDEIKELQLLENMKKILLEVL